MKNKHAMLDPVVKSRLHEEIVRQIQRKIVRGEFAIGEKLPSERDLAESLQVNRATLREALKKLELLGLVEIRHGDGIYVQNYLESGNLELFKDLMVMNGELDYGILMNILEIRRLLIPEMAARAAENRGDEELRQLSNEALCESDDGVLERDLGVHHAIARASGNMLYIFILNFFNQLFRDYGYLYFSDPENRKRSMRFHRDIFGAIDKRQPEKAKKIMRDVLVYTEKQIQSYYADERGRLPGGG